MSKSDRVKRPQSAREAEFARGLQEGMKTHGYLLLELLLQQTSESWKDFLYGTPSAKVRKELVPIAIAELMPYGLAKQQHVDDLVQRLYVKLLEGKYFKKFRAWQSVPKAYIMGCAPFLAKTIARSIWRECRRNVTNVDWSQE